MGDSNPEPRPPSPLPSTSRKSDAELLLEHGITKECNVCVCRLAKFLTNQKQMPEPQSRQPEPQKVFRVHYGRHFLHEIAEDAYRSKPDRGAVDLNDLYSQYITSQFSALDRTRFKSILQSYHGHCQEEFNRRRADLIAKKVAAVTAKRRAAIKRRKIFYKGSFVVVSDDIGEEAKRALQDGRRSRVVLERIRVDTPANRPPSDDPEQVQVDTPADGPPSDDPEPTLDKVHEPPQFDHDDPYEATTKLIRDLIEKTSLDLESSGFFRDYPEDVEEDDETDYASPDSDSEDTIESPMEVEFGTGESPDFSNVLRIQGEEFDSEETCHGNGNDDFVTQQQSRSSYTCDTDHSNSGPPVENGIENGDVKNNHNNNNSSSGDDEEANCVIKQNMRRNSIVVMPLKLAL